jgi:CheY-like chemotaxis protein
MDTGKGIDLTEPNVIFEPFRQEEKGYTREYGGSGLGLTITKRLVELLDGEIWAETEVGKDHGSKFYFTISFSARKKIEKKKDSEIITPKTNTVFKGLIAEDDEDSRKFLRKALEEAGYNVIEACDGNDAVAKYKKYSDIDFIIMDLRMPVMDGFHATKEIRKLETDNGRKIPILALSAATMENEEARSIKAGCNAFLPKPVMQIDLIKILSEHLY